MHFLVGAVISSVYVAVNGRSNHGMIESGIEVDFVVLVVAFYFNLSELPVPVCFRFGEVFVEIVFGHFSLQVLGCAFHACAGNSCVYEYLLPFLGVEVEAGDDGFADAFVFLDDGCCVQLHFLKRTGEAGAEVDVLVACPPVGEAVALDGDGVYHFDM